MPSLTEVAKKAGVSIATASLVLNSGRRTRRVGEACAARVRQVAEQLGYVPNYHAQSMKRGRADVIAVALDVDYSGAKLKRNELGATYYGTIVGAIEASARSHGNLMAIVGPQEDLRAPDRGLLGIRQRRFDGMIVLGPAVHREHTDFLAQPHAEPIVVIEYAAKTDLPVVDWDEPGSVKLAVRHLAELGHKDLLWLGPRDEHTHAPAPRREELFRRHVRDAGLRGQSCCFERIQGSADYLADLADAAEGALAERLKNGPRVFTGVVCYNDVTAIGACGALMAAGLRIPDDVSVIGFDDVEAPLAIPRLTTVSHRLDEMGRRATELVLQWVEDPAAVERLRGRRVLLEPELVVRKSTGKCKGRG